MNNRRSQNVRRFLAMRKRAERGEGQGQGGSRQGDGGTSRCKCPECGHVQDKPKGEPCSKQTCNNCGHEGMVGMDKSASTHNIQSFLSGLLKQGKIVKDKGTNSEGKECDWAIKSHEDGHIISRHKTEEEAKEHLQRMKAHSED